ncbi:UNVERIFIED_CONTAM: hypothetical protein HDU68_000965 [Siphonaria sp. JEL0065]|nr:hypothetical protein HDU68_000965 [Siphonaria sp. JEL0065]
MAFSQSASVSRCRNVKETKLKAQHALAKLADEEVTIYSANLDEARHQLRTQILEQTAVDLRQNAEAEDAKVSWSRKEQLNHFVEKLSSMKSLLQFQEEARERETAFKSSIRQKRAAFQVRLARLEQRQLAERNELNFSQTRLADTINQIRAIEIKGIKDKNKARRMKRDNEIQSQQASMRQQKESEFLRELQLCKARQTGELNDLEINNMEEIEEIVTQQRLDEFDLVSKQLLIEGELESALESQKCKLEASQLLDKQKSVKSSLQRGQRKQASALAKAQRAATRTREKILVAENPIIKGDESLAVLSHGEEESVTDSQSEGTSRSGGSNLSLHENDGDNTEKKKSEAEKNSALN